MVFNREEAARRAEAAVTNTPGYCQAWTNEMFGAPAVGDFDGDRSADAEDGWKSEPRSARHRDRNPPRGVPVSYLGGSNDNGHRAVSLGNGKIRSTDAAGSGRVATVDLDWPERVWGLKYVGWSETISGIHIPLPEPPKPTRISRFLEKERPYRMWLLDRAIAGGRRGTVKSVRDAIDAQIDRLPHDKHPNSVVNQIVDDYHNRRLLRMGELNRAVSRGRRGTVKSVRDEIRRQIDRLPKR